MSQPSDSVRESALSLPAAVQSVRANDDASGGERALWVRHLLVLACGVALMLSAVRAVRGIREEASIALNHVSGAWATLALDFANAALRAGFRQTFGEVGALENFGITTFPDMIIALRIVLKIVAAFVIEYLWKPGIIPPIDFGNEGIGRWPTVFFFRIG